MNLNVHFHTLVPDGVFDLPGEGPARFVPLPAPSDEEVEKVLAAVIRKVARAGLLELIRVSDSPIPKRRFFWSRKLSSMVNRFEYSATISTAGLSP